MNAAAPLGPASVRTDRPRDAALRILRLLASAPDAMTIADIHTRLGGHPNRFRSPLDRLVADGFADETTVASGGRGRPARAYTASAVGAQVALEDPDRTLLDALIEGAADVLSRSHDPVGRARMLGTAWGRRFPEQGFVESLAAQGFAPRVECDRIVLRTCPMLGAARRNSEVVCAIHLGLMEAISGRSLALAPFAEPGVCVIDGLPGSFQRRDLS